MHRRLRNDEGVREALNIVPSWRFHLLGWVLASLVAPACATKIPAARAPRPPNIVLLVADDLGFDDLGVNNNPKATTPNLDAMAAQSVRFDQFTVTPVCAPTRASLLTGRHFLLTGVSHVHGGKDFIRRDEVLLGQVLQRAGYRTGMWGKWHSGTTQGYLPWQRGFHEAYMANLYQHRNSHGLLNGQPVSYQRWADEVIVDHAIDFIKRSGKSPFFAYLPFLTCHSPLDAPDDLISAHQAKGFSRSLATLYAMVTQMDREVGRLLTFLREQDLLQDTVVLFLSDNGPATNAPTLSPADHAARNVNGYKGRKGDLWENGIKSPLFVLGEGRFTPGRVRALYDVVDIFPTLLDLAGIGASGGLPLSGQSFLAALKDTATPAADRIVYYYAHPAWSADGEKAQPSGRLHEYEPIDSTRVEPFSAQFTLGARNNRYKLLWNPNSQFLGEVHKSERGDVLLDMQEDPRESKNAEGTAPANVAPVLRGALERWANATLRHARAFAAPTFVIEPDSRENRVLAYGLRGGSPSLHNATLLLRGWGQPGQEAHYLIEATADGCYQPRLVWKNNPAHAPDGFQVSIDDQPAPDAGPLLIPGGPHTLNLRYVANTPVSSLDLVEIHLDPACTRPATSATASRKMETAAPETTSFPSRPGSR